MMLAYFCVFALLAILAVKILQAVLYRRDLRNIYQEFSARKLVVKEILPVTRVASRQWWRERDHPGGARRYKVEYFDSAGSLVKAHVRTGFRRGITIYAL
ncbi:MAG: hypothetical protein ACRCV9_17430 [Burkholderiaceae bacterium]